MGFMNYGFPKKRSSNNVISHDRDYISNNVYRLKTNNHFYYIKINFNLHDVYEKSI